MMLVRMNHLELTTESNKTRLSIIRFYTLLASTRSEFGMTDLVALF